jgi:hypothetical protein
MMTENKTNNDFDQIASTTMGWKFGFLTKKLFIHLMYRFVSISVWIDYSPFCVPAKVIKLVGLTRPPFLSPTNLITFAVTQNGE